ncbi:hypothetical protein [Solibacillus palustris]|nr:hypothetical protein [Solibacillus sp. MA9]
MKNDLLQPIEAQELVLSIEENVYEDYETCFIQYVTASLIIELN